MSNRMSTREINLVILAFLIEELFSEDSFDGLVDLLESVEVIDRVGGGGGGAGICPDALCTTHRVASENTEGSKCGRI